MQSETKMKYILMSLYVGYHIKTTYLVSTVCCIKQLRIFEKIHEMNKWMINLSQC